MWGAIRGWLRTSQFCILLKKMGIAYSRLLMACEARIIGGAKESGYADWEKA